ncbi:MAG: NTP transferase domain-containing protein [Ignavibacteriae bacterium]|nr:NTP transferase domain-containing protein [Ignavibacteria bacterium]MBI3364573.1 NTP transferase domain-containing protein [Ignavibacteriota bacterium]
MKAAIIAAGEGSRLKSEGIALPKPLVPVNGIPLIERLIATFIRNGITEIACIVNEYSLEVKRFIEQKHFPITIDFVVRTTPSSMHSLFALATHLRDEQFLLSTVDSIFHEEEFCRYLQYAQGKASLDGILAITNFIDDENPLYVEMDAQKRILRFAKKTNVTLRGEKEEWVTGGMYVFSPRIFNEIDVVLNRNIERLRNFLSHLVENGYTLEGYPFSKIVDVDHVQDIRTAEEWLHENPK